jgi:hypothetical protein
MIEGDLRMFVASKAVGFSCRDSSFVVEALGSAVSEASFGNEPVEELASMLSERASELLEGLQSRAHGHGGPAVEKAPGPKIGGVGPEVLEVLFEQVGANGAKIDGEQLAEACTLGAAQVGRLLEQKPTRLGEHRVATGRAQAPQLIASNGVDGLAE